VGKFSGFAALHESQPSVSKRVSAHRKGRGPLAEVDLGGDQGLSGYRGRPPRPGATRDDFPVRGPAIQMLDGRRGPDFFSVSTGEVGWSG